MSIDFWYFQEKRTNKLSKTWLQYLSQKFELNIQAKDVSSTFKSKV